MKIASIWLGNEIVHMLKPKAKNEKLGSGCGSVGRTVACDTRGLRSKSNHW